MMEGKTWVPTFIPDPDDISHVLQINEKCKLSGWGIPEPIYITQDKVGTQFEGVNVFRIR